jgi:hypothetical protein
MSEDTYHPVTHYPVTEYRCGARTGDRVRLRREIGSHPAGEIWSVLPGAVEEPIVVWLRQADDETHTWSEMKIFCRRLRFCDAMPPNQAMERTATRRASTFCVASALSLQSTRSLGGRRSSCSR